MAIDNAVGVGFPSDPRRHAHPHASAWQAILGMLSGIAEGWRAYQRWQDLESLSDGHLRRIGIDRRDTARYAVFGHTAAHAE